ncbi:hypothetical protein SUGI_1198700 [Cryptomeria japonica]|nr:hypothetical protein SUGI_1198700 [Cryptomeria japonica]
MHFRDFYLCLPLGCISLEEKPFSMRNRTLLIPEGKQIRTRIGHIFEIAECIAYVCGDLDDSDEIKV